MFHRYYLPEQPLSRPHTIIDLGANIGITAAHLAYIYPSANVIAVELDIENAALAQRNVAAFANRVRIVNAAIWTEDTTLGVVGTDHDAYHLAPDVENPSRTVRGMSMATLLREENVERVDFLKMDIEGAESDLLLSDDVAWLDKIDTAKIEIHNSALIGPLMERLEAVGLNCRRGQRHWASVWAYRQ